MSGLPGRMTKLMNSSLCEVQATATAGRGVFALEDIPRNTTLMTTSAIASAAIYSEYNKEVCAQCFAYDRGNVWKIRDNASGVVFCSGPCQSGWQRDTNEDIRIARAEILQLLLRASRGGDSHAKDTVECAEGYTPSAADIDFLWHEAELLADHVRACRMSETPTKAMRRALQIAKSPRYLDDGVVWYLLEACMRAAKDPEGWAGVEQLAKTDQAYQGLELRRHIQAYLLLLATMPQSRLPSIRQSVIRSLQAHTVHNVFGIRSLDEGGEEGDAGSECFGYGLWPVASYWNHSCAPNVQKQRNGRTWRFWTRQDVPKGEELCITYLGGDERGMSTKERRKKLLDCWGFDCACGLCCSEET